MCQVPVCRGHQRSHDGPPSTFHTCSVRRCRTLRIYCLDKPNRVEKPKKHKHAFAQYGPIKTPSSTQATETGHVDTFWPWASFWGLQTKRAETERAKVTLLFLLPSPCPASCITQQRETGNRTHHRHHHPYTHDIGKNNNINISIIEAPEQKTEARTSTNSSNSSTHFSHSCSLSI